MSPAHGRPPSNDPKRNDTRIRLTDGEAEKLAYCANKIGMSKADIIRKGIDLIFQKTKGEFPMKVIVSQRVKIKGDNFPHRWSKEYESVIIPHMGASIEDPIWKDPYEYKVIDVVINYYANECYVQVEDYNVELPKERKDDFNHMANLHGWKTSWGKLG